MVYDHAGGIRWRRYMPSIANNFLHFQSFALKFHTYHIVMAGTNRESLLRGSFVTLN